MQNSQSTNFKVQYLIGKKISTESELFLNTMDFQALQR